MNKNPLINLNSEAWKKGRKFKKGVKIEAGKTYTVTYPGVISLPVTWNQDTYVAPKQVEPQNYQKHNCLDALWAYPVVKDRVQMRAVAGGIVKKVNSLYPEHHIYVLGIGTSGAMMITAVLFDEAAGDWGFALFAKIGESTHRGEVSNSGSLYNHKLTYPEKTVLVVVDDQVGTGNTARNIAKIAKSNNLLEFIKVIAIPNSSYGDHLNDFPNLEHLIY